MLSSQTAKALEDLFASGGANQGDVNMALMMNGIQANTNGLPICNVQLAPGSSFFIPNRWSKDGDRTLQSEPRRPTSEDVIRRRTSSQPTAAFRGFPGVMLYNDADTIKNGTSQEVYLTNFRDGAEVTIRLLSAYDKQHLFAPHKRPGWNIATVSSYDGSSDHVMVPWEVKPNQAKGTYFIAAYEKNAPAVFAYSQAFHINGPVRATKTQLGPQVSNAVHDLSHVPVRALLEKIRQPARPIRRLGVASTVFSASGRA